LWLLKTFIKYIFQVCIFDRSKKLIFSKENLEI
jgi:hypothetical protein